MSNELQTVNGAVAKRGAARMEPGIVITDELVAAVCEANRDQVLAALPFQAAEFASLMSFAELLRLASHYAGGRAWIPVKTEGSELLQFVSHETLERMSKRWPVGGPVYICSSGPVVQAAMPFIVADLLRRKFTRRTIAEAIGVSTRTVRRYELRAQALLRQQQTRAYIDAQRQAPALTEPSGQ